MRPNPRTDKILITIPFWNGDKAQAMKLARLLADLEPSHSGAADVAFIARPDCKQDKDTIGYVSKKFNVHTVRSVRSETGWPNGCNGLFFGNVEWCLRSISAAKIPHYKAIFVCASDSAPLVGDAVLYLHRQWDALLRLPKPPCIAGPMVPAGPHGHAHINGDCTLLSSNLDFLFWLVKGSGGVIRGGRGGWDWAMAPEFQLRGWADIPGIKSHWRRPTFHESEWQPHVDAGVAWLHGTKDDSLLDLARKKLLS